MNEKKHSSTREKRLNVAEELVSHKENKNKQRLRQQTCKQQIFMWHFSNIYSWHTESERETREGEKGRGEKLVRTATDLEIICSLAAFLIIAARSKQKTLATNLKWKWILSINSICMGERERRLKKKITTKTVFNQFQLHTTETATNDFFEIGLAFGLTKIFCHCRR